MMLGIDKNVLKCQIIYTTNTNVNQEIINRCANYWSKVLDINKNQIVSVTKSSGKIESLLYGSCRLYIDNSSLSEVLLYGSLPKLIEMIKNPKTQDEIKMLHSFLRGLFAAEGYVPSKRLDRVTLSFDQNSQELGLYKILLSNMGISTGKSRKCEVPIYGNQNLKRLKEINVFSWYKSKQNRFIKGYKKLKLINKLV